MRYIAPEFATIAIETEDIILASGGGNSGSGGENVGRGDDMEL